MNILRLLMFLAISACVLVRSVAQEGPQRNFNSLGPMITMGTITRIQLLRMPDAVMTRVAVTPTVLRSSTNYTVIFNQDISKTFGTLFSGVSIKAESHTPDLRWGLLFYDAENNETTSLFVDKFGREGYLNGEAVSFIGIAPEANLAKRLRKIIESLR